MSAGHDSDQEPVLNSQALDRILANSTVKGALWELVGEDDEHDCPYIGGYSTDGKTIYLDRHLPKVLSYEQDGLKKEFSPREFIRMHEILEKILIQDLHYSYWPAHAAANGFERRHVLQVLGPGAWTPYSNCLLPFIKADEKERLQKVPKDLDLTPYFAPPVSKSLISHLQKAMGAERKHSKEEVGYGEGRPSAHCGPVKEWGGGDCKNFERPAACNLVRGHIGSRMWCKLWERRT